MNILLQKLHNNRESFLYLLLILFIHGVFLNKFEKIYFEKYSGSNIKYRPLGTCKNNNSFKCLGMPSGHSEMIVILCVFLVIKKIIPIEIAIILIFLVGLQRIFFDMHSLLQVIVGIIFGLIYSYIYIITDYSFLSLLITISLTILFAILIKIY